MPPRDRLRALGRTPTSAAGPATRRRRRLARRAACRAARLDLAAGTGKLARALADARPRRRRRRADRRDARGARRRRPRRGPRGHAEAIPLPTRRGRRHRRAGVSLVRRPARDGGDPPRAAAGRDPRARLQPAADGDEIHRRIDELLAPYRGDMPAHADERWREPLARARCSSRSTPATFDNVLSSTRTASPTLRFGQLRRRSDEPARASCCARSRRSRAARP